MKKGYHPLQKVEYTDYKNCDYAIEFLDGVTDLISSADKVIKD